MREDVLDPRGQPDVKSLSFILCGFTCTTHFVIYLLKYPTYIMTMDNFIKHYFIDAICMCFELTVLVIAWFPYLAFVQLFCFRIWPGYLSWLGLGFITSITFIFLVGVFMSSWLGASVLALGEWVIKRMPFVRHIYSASKQISSAISPGTSPWFSFYVYIRISTLLMLF